MRRTYYLLGILFFFLSATVHAQRVSREEALQKAVDFLKSNESRSKSAGVLRSSSLTEATFSEVTDELYLFNVGDSDGYVIVSGEGSTPSILGYSDKGQLAETTIPVNMYSWISGYAEDIRVLRTTRASSVTTLSRHPAISPLIDAQWGQDSPYSNSCPTSGGNRCVTGCVATAMAQILYYHRPSGCTSLEGYYNSATGTNIGSLSATSFDWSVIRPTYGRKDGDRGAAEVAKLMRYCGQSISTEYGLSESSASTVYVPGAFTKNFGMYPGIHSIERKMFPSERWDDIIYEEIASHRPVLVRGRNIEGGHAFVCDGYDGNGMYHINWGWNGTANGYFLLSDLNPENQGIGGTSGSYNGDVNAVVGIRLSEEEESTAVTLYANQILNFTSASSRTGINGDFRTDIRMQYSNMTAGTTDYETTFGLYTLAGDLVDVSAKKYNVTLSPFYAMKVTAAYTFGKGITDGTYLLKPLSRLRGSEEWELCHYADRVAITVDIKGNSATFSYELLGKDEDYTARNLFVTGNKTANVSQSLSALITNAGSYYSSNIYIVDNGEVKHFFAADLAPGETATLSTPVIFTTAGRHNIYLAIESYDESTSQYVYKRISDILAVDILAEQFSSLKVKSQILSTNTINDGITLVPEGDVSLSVTYTNEGKSAYRSLAGYFLGTVEDNKIYYSVDPVSISLDLGAGESKTVVYVFHGLESGQRYVLLPTYKTSSTDWKKMWQEGVSVRCEGVATIMSVTSAADTARDAFGINGVKASGKSTGIIIRDGRKYIAR